MRVEENNLKIGYVFSLLVFFPFPLFIFFFPSLYFNFTSMKEKPMRQHTNM
jgi:hypothetical protein